MKNYILFLFLFCFVSLSFSQRRYLNKIEAYSLSLSPTYNFEDAQYGFNGKIYIPLDKRLYFISQGTFIYPFTNKGYEELRASFNIELNVIHRRTFSVYGSLGYNIGTWRRNYFLYDGPDMSPDFDQMKFHVDQSFIVGGGFAYHFKKSSLFIEHKYFTNIYLNLSGIGFRQVIYKKPKKRKTKHGTKL